MLGVWQRFVGVLSSPYPVCFWLHLRPARCANSKAATYSCMCTDVVRLPDSVIRLGTQKALFACLVLVFCVSWNVSASASKGCLCWLQCKKKQGSYSWSCWSCPTQSVIYILFLVSNIHKYFIYLTVQTQIVFNWWSDICRWNFSRKIMKYCNYYSKEIGLEFFGIIRRVGRMYLLVTVLTKSVMPLQLYFKTHKLGAVTPPLLHPFAPPPSRWGVGCFGRVSCWQKRRTGSWNNKNERK